MSAFCRVLLATSIVAGKYRRDLQNPHPPHCWNQLKFQQFPNRTCNRFVVSGTTGLAAKGQLEPLRLSPPLIEDSSAGNWDDYFGKDSAMGVTVGELARRVEGVVRGNDQLVIVGAASLRHAGRSEITFASDERHFRQFKSTVAGAAIVGQDFAAKFGAEIADRTLIVVTDPFEAFMAVLQEFRPQRPRPEIGRAGEAYISPSAQIGPDCNIYPGAYIGDDVIIGAGCDIHPGVVIEADCRLGEQCTLYPNVVLYPRVVLGDRVIVHASAVLGADGFGYKFREGCFKKIPQLGSVLVQDDVEIGACTTIDRGMIGPTIIGEGTKLDNLIMIGHNCELGKHNAFASQVGFAGSVTTGDYVRCAGQVGIADHVHLGTGAVLGAKAGVHKDMAAGGTYLGVPATEEHEQIKIVMALRKLPDLRKQVRVMEEQLEQLKRQFQALNTSDVESLGT
jgi:UDP-3-O-[3-hydroxymyristoyl] glucosamine N-acyltransferase